MRVIARLDIKGPNVVKGIHMEGLRVVGNPKELAEKYYAAGVDELIYLDIVASLYQRNPDFEQLKNVSENIFIPLTVGGGIRSLHDIGMALQSGADKVAINTFALQNPDFIREAAEVYGAQCIVLLIEAKKTGTGTWEAYTDGGREHSGVDVLAWVKKGIELGAGEILLTSIDADGTKAGYDLELIRAVRAVSSVPVIAHGGAGSVSDMRACAQEHVSGVAASSLFHYNLASVADVKESLAGQGIEVRPL